MVEAISSYGVSGEDLYEIRKMLLESNSEKKLSSKQNEESSKALSKRQAEEEKVLSSKMEEADMVLSETEEENVENVSEEKIVVKASELEVLDIKPVVSNPNIENEEEYNPEMDFDGDGIITDEERIKYYSQKYEEYDKNNGDVEVQEVSSGATNPISNNMSLINKMQANYGKTTPEIQSGLAILV